MRTHPVEKPFSVVYAKELSDQNRHWMITWESTQLCWLFPAIPVKEYSDQNRHLLTTRKPTKLCRLFIVISVKDLSVQKVHWKFTREFTQLSSLLPAWFVEKAFFAYLCWLVTWKLTNKKNPSNFRPVGKSFTHKKNPQLSSTAHIRIRTGEKTLSLVNFVANVLIRFSHFRLYKAKKLYIVVPFELNENFWILI